MLPIVPWRTLRVQPLALNTIHLMCMLGAPRPNLFGNVSTAVQKQATIVKQWCKLDMNCGREASVSQVNVFLRKTGSPVNALPYVLNVKTSMVRATFAAGSPAVLLHPSRLAVFGEAVDESDPDSTFPNGRAVAPQKESVCRAMMFSIGTTCATLHREEYNLITVTNETREPSTTFSESPPPPYPKVLHTGITTSSSYSSSSCTWASRLANIRGGGASECVPAVAIPVFCRQAGGSRLKHGRTQTGGSRLKHGLMQDGGRRLKYGRT
jgi:hypothetical protein